MGYNQKLVQSLSAKGNIDDLIRQLGFEYRNDEYITDWRYETNHFSICIEPSFEVQMYRKNPDTDNITIQCESYDDLKDLVYWATDDENLHLPVSVTPSPDAWKILAD